VPVPPAVPFELVVAAVVDERTDHDHPANPPT
jgi:hypothetical protein